ncbi:MAG: penicillin acylase family protein [Micromonosporaceae bacterium]|nr:penicillin acylase family protein [Micromonosporaceae bacterium]
MARRRWQRLGRYGLGALAGLLVLVQVVGLLAVWSARRPFPTYDGQLPLAGLSAPVTVYRDAHGIPQIYAATIPDLFRAQGYVHAQDRFWEMDFRRHVTSGRLAEWFGPDQVETDAFLRTLGWRRVAEAEWALVSPETRDYLTAYAEGVNAWVAGTGGPAATGRKALQYRLLGVQSSGYQIAPWDPVDSLAWLKAMAWDLRGNLEDEIERARLLAAGLGTDQVDQLYPAYPYEQRAPIVTAGRVVDGGFDPDAPAGEAATGEPPAAGELSGAARPLAALQSSLAELPRLLGTAGAGLGSNSWVVGGEHTASGAPILANDPHLGVSMPGIWHQVGLHCTCGYRVSGFSFSGLPGVVIGHNERIAWGFTNLGSDVTDLYLERIDGDRYQVDGQWRDLTVREETIRVAGGEDVTIRVRQTHRGPVVSDASEELQELADGSPGDPEQPPATQALSLAWTALQPGRTIEALFALNQATGWDDFRAAAELFEVPAQNLIYADVDGNIGYQAPGVVPVRGTGDGRIPAPGWDPAYDWRDPVPFEQLPSLLNPPDGLVVTANQPVIGPQYQPHLTDDWAYGYRSDRIHELLAEQLVTGPVTVDDMRRIQFDSRNGLAPTLVPALLTAADPAPSRDEAAALDLLRRWDFQQPADGDPGTPQADSSAAAAYFNAVWRQLLALTFDELPDDQQPIGGGRWFQVVTGLLDEPAAPWWDRTGTPPPETRDDVLARALAEGYKELAAAQGDHPRDWRWGRMHTLTLRDATFGSSGIGPVEALFNRGPVQTAGGPAIVNANAWNAAEGYEVTATPSMRMVIDMSDLDGAGWVQMTGNSGHPYHPNYLDQLEPWRTGELLPWRWHRPTIEAEATDTLALRP